MAKRYYDLNVDGRILGSYARRQPGRELVLLDEAPASWSRWDGEAWMDDNEERNAVTRREKIAEIGGRFAEFLYDNAGDPAIIGKLNTFLLSIKEDGDGRVQRPG